MPVVSTTFAVPLAGSCALRSSGPVQKCSAPSDHTASSGVTCGRPSGRTVEIQNSSAFGEHRPVSDQGSAVAPSLAVAGVELGSWFHTGSPYWASSLSRSPQRADSAPARTHRPHVPSGRFLGQALRLGSRPYDLDPRQEAGDDDAGAQEQYLHAAAAARFHRSRPPPSGCWTAPSWRRCGTTRCCWTRSARPPTPTSRCSGSSGSSRRRTDRAASASCWTPWSRQAAARPAARGARRLRGARRPSGPAPARLAGPRHLRAGRSAPGRRGVRARPRRGHRPGRRCASPTAAACCPSPPATCAARPTSPRPPPNSPTSPPPRCAPPSPSPGPPRPRTPRCAGSRSSPWASAAATS